MYAMCSFHVWCPWLPTALGKQPPSCSKTQITSYPDLLIEMGWGPPSLWTGTQVSRGLQGQLYCTI